MTQSDLNRAATAAALSHGRALRSLTDQLMARVPVRQAPSNSATFPARLTESIALYSAPALDFETMGERLTGVAATRCPNCGGGAEIQLVGIGQYTSPRCCFSMRTTIFRRRDQIVRTTDGIRAACRLAVEVLPVAEAA
jgi:hypothetical protein